MIPFTPLTACTPQDLGSWGSRVKYEAPRPILGLAAHPSESELVVLHADGFLRGYSCGGEALGGLWAVQGEW